MPTLRVSFRLKMSIWINSVLYVCLCVCVWEILSLQWTSVEPCRTQRWKSNSIDLFFFILFFLCLALVSQTLHPLSFHLFPLTPATLSHPLCSLLPKCHVYVSLPSLGFLLWNKTILGSHLLFCHDIFWVTALPPCHESQTHLPLGQWEEKRSLFQTFWVITMKYAEPMNTRTLSSVVNLIWFLVASNCSEYFFLRSAVRHVKVALKWS